MSQELQIIIAAVAAVLGLIFAGFKLRKRVQWNKAESGAPIKWEKLPVFVNWSKHLQAKHSDMVHNAIQVWNYGLGKTVFMKGIAGSLEESVAMKAIYFMYDPIDDDDTLGQAEVMKDPETGLIDHAIVRLDPPADQKEAARVMPGTCQHELGHCLGMGHSDYAEDLMYRKNVEGRATVGKQEREAFKKVYEVA